MAIIFPVELYTSTSTSVPKETDPSVQFITMKPVETVTRLPVNPSPASGMGFTAFILADYFIVASTVFLALWSSTVSFFVSGKLCRSHRLLDGHDGRDKALHSLSRSFPGCWAVRAQSCHWSCQCHCLIHIEYLQSVEMTKNKCKENPAFKTLCRGQYAN